MSDNSESETIAAGFLQYLEKQDKLGLLPSILAVLRKQVEPQLPEIVVESSIALSDADRRSILESLSSRPHSGEVQFKVNPDLIGGIKVTYGDSVLDLSVQGRLKKVYA